METETKTEIETVGWVWGVVSVLLFALGVVAVGGAKSFGALSVYGLLTLVACLVAMGIVIATGVLVERILLWARPRRVRT